MKYRIREVIKNDKHTYYPERTILWFWCGYSNNVHPEFSNDVYFSNLEEAKKFIIRKTNKTKVIYHYFEETPKAIEPELKPQYFKG